MIGTTKITKIGLVDALKRMKCLLLVRPWRGESHLAGQNGWKV